MITQETIQSLSSRIAKDFNPDKIVLFGSYAYGTARPDSDLDLLVIMPFQGSSFRKSLEILNCIDPPFDVDLIARRPEEIEKSFREGDPLAREAMDKGKVLYDRHG